MKKDHKLETRAIIIQANRTEHKENSVPVFETSSFVFDNAEQARAVFADEIPGYLYTRFSNPNSDELISKLCSLEGAEDGIATASGMAAVFLGFISLLRPGDHILVSRNIFGSTHLMITQILSRWGISHTYIKTHNITEWKNSILPTTRMIFTESPANPGLEITDIEKLGKLAAQYGLYLIVDNTFATPYLQRPILMGADLVIHSTTKFMDGQGRTIGGVILGSAETIGEIRPVARITGPTMAPHNAWIISKGIETLAVRMERHCTNALSLAKFLEKSASTSWVKYPFLPSHPQFSLAKKQMALGGGLVCFELQGGQDRALKFLDALKIIKITPNLGDSRTLITHPATTTHSKLTPEEKQEAGITNGMLRISVGLENIDDILDDVQQAIESSE